MEFSVDIKAAALIAVMAAGTMITRFLPFCLFPAGKKTPQFIEYLGKTLPYATIGLLMVYCLRNITPLQGTGGAPEFLAVALVMVIHRWKRNSLLSIGAGTLFYMFLIQRVF